MPIRTTLVAALLAVASHTGFAQGPTAPSATPRLDQRQANQERRIEQGRTSGALTRHEARRLHREQAAIGKAEGAAKADGTVTRAERRRLHRMQNHASRDIARQKHDAQAARTAP